MINLLLAFILLSFYLCNVLFLIVFLISFISFNFLTILEEKYALFIKKTKPCNHLISMPEINRIYLSIWRLLVGLNNGSKWSFNVSASSPSSASNANFSLLHFLLFLLLLSGDVHPHPGPNNKKTYNF